MGSANILRAVIFAVISPVIASSLLAEQTTDVPQACNPQSGITADKDNAGEVLTNSPPCRLGEAERTQQKNQEQRYCLPESVIIIE